MNTKHPFETVQASADVMKLAEMILSDCGQSTVISDSLQLRVAGRIQQHRDSALVGHQQVLAALKNLKEAVEYTPLGIRGLAAVRQAAEAIAAAEQAQQAEPVNQQQAGVYHKFNVSRTDGRDQPGGDRYGAEYFVLDVTHDKFAKPALAAYAAACRNDYPALTDDMVRRYGIAKQQAEPVAWVRFCSDGCYEGPLMNSSPAMDGARRTSGAWTPLFAAQPVERDVLMAAMRAAVAECAEICDVYSSYKGARCASEIRHPIMNSKLADIADRYAAQPPAVAEGCGACGDGCQGQGCRLERESPPTCQTCNGKGMIGGLLPNGGGYDGEPCPDCTAPQATAEDSSMVRDAEAVPKAPTWYKRSDIVKALERMNYHTAIADELADWFLRHMQQAFNRGFYQAHGPAAATQLEELELWHLLERATGELTRRAAPHAWEQIAWRAGTEFIEQRRARLAAAQKGGAA